MDTSAEIMSIRGREWVNLPRRRQTEFVNRAFCHWRHTGFPHYALTRRQVETEFINLAKQPVSAFDINGVAGSTTGLRLANFFQPQMWSVRVSRYLSPQDVFFNDDLLRAAIARSWTIWPDRFGANPATLRRMLKTFPGVAAVSNFRPTLARCIIERFSKPNQTVMDFAAGYGGRLLGAMSAQRNYIGIEPCLAQVRGLRKMSRALHKFHGRSESQILAGCAEDVLPNIPGHTAHLVFSSPPYFDWERYSDHATQSFRRHSTYEAWKLGFLTPVLEHSARVLRPGGYLALNLSGRHRKPSIEEAVDICHTAKLELLMRVPLLVTRVPYLHPRNSVPHKQEVLLIFRKGRSVAQRRLP